jgi:hypothetical protein
MNTKQSATGLAVLLAAVSLNLAAAPKGDNPGKGSEHAPMAHGQDDEHKNDLRIHVRTDEEKKSRGNQDNENSNRQSDEDSTRGQERAEERRDEHADQAHDKDNDDHPWYDPFGIFTKAGDRAEKDAEHVEKQAEKRWWWPF